MRAKTPPGSRWMVTARTVRLATWCRRGTKVSSMRASVADTTPILSTPDRCAVAAAAAATLLRHLRAQETTTPPPHAPTLPGSRWMRTAMDAICTIRTLGLATAANTTPTPSGPRKCAVPAAEATSATTLPEPTSIPTAMAATSTDTIVPAANTTPILLRPG